MKTENYSSLHDVKLFRCADVNSDHHLLIGKIKLTLKRYITSYKYGIQYNVRYLQNEETKQTFMSQSLTNTRPYNNWWMSSVRQTAGGRLKRLGLIMS